jgi:hypothetical protein
MVSDSLKRIAEYDGSDGYVQAIKESSVTAFAGEDPSHQLFNFIPTDPQWSTTSSLSAASETVSLCVQLTSIKSPVILILASQTASTLLIFVLAMVLNPEVQERAQAEIDSVIGTVRLPAFEDRPSLPYIEAVLRETLRWHPAVPLSDFVFSLCPFFPLIRRWPRHSPCNYQRRCLRRLFHSSRRVSE